MNVNGTNYTTLDRDSFIKTLAPTLNPNISEQQKDSLYAAFRPTQASTTTISNGNKISQVPGIQAKTNQLSQTGVTTDPTSGISTNANGTVATPPSDDSTPKQPTTNGGYNGDVYVPPGAPIPKDADGNDVTLTATSPADDQIRASIQSLISKSDATTASMIQNIQSQYQNLIQQQQTANKGQEAGVNNALLMGGATGQGSSAQYAPVSSAGIMSSQVNYGLQQISDLQNKEQQAITQAQAAGDSQDYQLMDKLNQQIASTRQEKQDAANKLNDQITAQNTKLADQAYQQKQATNTAIQGILKDAADNGITDPTILSAIGNSTTLEGAIAAAGGSLQKMTGDFADYPQYQKDAQANGLTPLSATNWLNQKNAQDAKNKANEAYGTAFATAKGKAAGEAAATGGSNQLLPVTSNSGLTFQVPASVAPYVKISPNGVKYVDVSGLTAAEKGKIQVAAFNGGVNPIPVIVDPAQSLDVSNIADATLKLQDMKTAFDANTAESAAQRNLYYAAAQTMAKKLQTDPNVVGLDVYQDAALDVLKAMSGTKGFRGGSSMVDAVKNSFPQSTDTKAVVDQKIANMQSLMNDRETGLVGKPNASDQAIIDAKNNQQTTQTKIQTFYNSSPENKKTVDTLYQKFSNATPEQIAAALGFQ